MIFKLEVWNCTPSNSYLSIKQLCFFFLFFYSKPDFQRTIIKLSHFQDESNYQLVCNQQWRVQEAEEPWPPFEKIGINSSPDVFVIGPIYFPFFRKLCSSHPHLGPSVYQLLDPLGLWTDMFPSRLIDQFSSLIIIVWLKLDLYFVNNRMKFPINW